MEQQMRMAKLLLDQQRVTFDGIMNNMIMFWDQTERMLGALVDQAAWVPPEGKGAFKEWIGGNKKGCESFKNVANEGFTWLDNFFSGRNQP